MQPASLRAETSPQPSSPARDRALDDMRGFLARMNPQSPSEALRLLRNAFPGAPLGLRVAACGI